VTTDRLGNYSGELKPGVDARPAAANHRVEGICSGEANPYADAQARRRHLRRDGPSRRRPGV